MNKPLLLALALISLGLISIAQEAIPRTEKTPLPWNDLNTKYSIIGSLGYPLGDLVTIECTSRKEATKGDSQWIEITAVNGKQLTESVKATYSFLIWSKIKGLEANKSYRLLVYENGLMKGLPEAVLKEIGEVQTQDYHFSTNLIVVRESK
jgi:hypothetical protein